MSLLAIDPGVHTGWALFEFNCLTKAGMGDPPVIPQVAIIEYPQIYRGAKSKADPNDLLKVAFQVGRYFERLTCSGTSVLVYKPADWKGNLTKSVTRARLESILTAQELHVIGNARHDIWDAVGLGKWFLAGKKRAGVFT